MHFKKNCFYGGKYFHGMYVNASMIKKYVEASMPKENVWKNGDFFKLFHAATTVNLHSTTIAFYEWIHVLLEVRFLLGLELSQLLRRNSHPMIHTLKKAFFLKTEKFLLGNMTWIVLDSGQSDDSKKSIFTYYSDEMLEEGSQICSVF